MPRTHRRTVHLALLPVLMSWALHCAPLAAQDPEQQALEAVREELQALEGRLARQHVERDTGYQALKSAELDIAASARELGAIRERLATQHERNNVLDQETVGAQERLVGEREALAEQVRMSYLTGRQELLKLLLNQETPAQMGRMMVYYDHLNRARSARVAAVGRELSTLAELSAESERAARELADLERAQAEELDALEGARDERRTVVAKLDEDIAVSGNELQRLREEEARLAQLVAELETLLAAFPVDSEMDFTDIKGDLAWPVPGSLISDFGQPRAGGQLRWNGVLVGAPAGTPVRAVYHGRVAYADWLPGLGLLVIVEHSAGYMSLYGHNEAILKESGDWVTPGDVIAQVGDSGGQAETALYFEIRKDGEPVDPRPWMGRRLQR